MPRTRLLKPGLYKNDVLAELPFEARYLFPGLTLLADREGRLEDRPKKIKGELMPFDNVDVDELLTLLAGKGFITRYEVEGIRYIQIDKFAEHQHPHPKEPKSVIPESCKKTARNVPSLRRNVKVETAEKRDKEGIVSGEGISGEGSGEGDGVGDSDTAKAATSWVAQFYEVFREGWNAAYPGQDYADVRSEYDFSKLAGIQNNRALTPQNWALACRHYFASPLNSHTMVDLVARYPAFLDHALDRYNKPVRGNGQTERKPKPYIFDDSKWD